MITVKGKNMIIPPDERTVSVEGDNMGNYRIFSIDRNQPNTADLSAMTFRLDFKYNDTESNTNLLTKTITEDGRIELMWNILENDLPYTGTIFIQLRGTDENGTVKWRSAPAAIYCEQGLSSSGGFSGNLSELEAIENKISKVIESEDNRITAENERVSAETQRQEEYESIISECETAAQNAEDSVITVSSEEITNGHRVTIKSNEETNSFDLENGISPTVGIGTVTTGEAGTAAKVTNSGTEHAAVFDFTIPQGKKGDTGDKGEKGDTPQKGIDYMTEGDIKDMVDEVKSTAGTVATIEIGETTTGEPGTEASVVNAGSTSAAILNFTIPKGEQGAKGEKGHTGPKGDTGEQGERGLPTTVNGKSADSSENITLTAADVGAYSKSETYSKEECNGIFSNDNLCRNGDFFFWQRGISFTEPNSFTADGWSCTGGSSTNRVVEKSFSSELNSNTLKYDSTACTSFDDRIVTYIENANRINGKQTTISFWVKTSLDDKTMHLQVRFYEGTTVNVSTTYSCAIVETIGDWNKYVCTFILSSDSTLSDENSFINILIVPYNSTGIGRLNEYTQFKVELSGIATLFTQENGENIISCQRYYMPYTDYTLTLNGISNSTAEFIEFSLALPVQMRVTPSIDKCTLNWIRGNGSVVDISGATVTVMGQVGNYLVLHVTVSGLSTMMPYSVNFKELAFDAEI